MPNQIKKKAISRQQAGDTGLAMVLICLLSLLAGPRPWLLTLAIVLLVITMTRPQLLTPVAKVWFGLSALLGSVVSRLLLSLVFFTVLTPIGLIRRWTGADSLQLKKWRRSSESVFTVREKNYTAADLEKPY